MYIPHVYSHLPVDRSETNLKGGFLRSGVRAFIVSCLVTPFSLARRNLALKTYVARRSLAFGSNFAVFFSGLKRK